MHLNAEKNGRCASIGNKLAYYPRSVKIHTLYIPQAYSSDEYPTGNYKTQHGVDNTE